MIGLGSMLHSVPVSVRRDLLDYIALAVELLAATTAIIGFTLWILRIRRRPEALFLWRISESGSPDHFQDWSPERLPTIHEGQTILVEASIRNTGDANADIALTNFVVPDCFDLHWYPDSSSTPVMNSTNATAGIKPGDKVFFIARERRFNVGMWWMHRFSLTLQRDPASNGARLLMELSDNRLNATGGRRGPSLIADPKEDEPTAAYGTPWDPKVKPKRALHWIRVGHPEEVRCWTGTRQTVRDLRVARPQLPGQADR